MHFINASSLWFLLPLVGIPLLIHWLSKRYPKKFLFSSVEEIRKTIAGRSRIVKWRHLLMMMLRTLALIALLLAFLKPMIAQRSSIGMKGRHIVLLVDHSLSMNYLENGVSARTKARSEVKRLLDSLSADDQFNLIRVNHAPTAAFTSYSKNAQAALDFLDQSPTPLTQADFRAANHLLTELSKTQKQAPDIYYFSDFQRRDWADVDFDSLPKDSRLFFIKATDDSQRGNRAIISLELGQGAVIAGGEVEAKARLANYSGQAWKGKIEIGFGPAHLRENEIQLAPWSEGEVTLDVPVPEGGMLKLTAALPEDNLAADNQRHLAVQVREREEVIILTGNENAESTPAPSLFLTTAVDPYAGKKGVYRPKHLGPSALNPSVLAASTRLIASRLPLLSDEQAGTLVQFLRSGGGIILFLDGQADPANLEKIANLAGQEMPLRPTEKLDSKNLADGLMRVATGDFNSRFLRLFSGVRRQNLALLEFYDIYHAAISDKGKILMKYADGTPALAESSIGLGTLLICNFSVSEASSNLARQRLFPAWIHEMLLRMSATGSAAMEPFLVGDSFSGETWSVEANGRNLLDSHHKPVRFRADLLGERTRISAVAEQTGFYRLPGNDHKDLLVFAVNTDPNQSDLRTIDPAVLPDRAGASHPEASYLGTTTDYQKLLHGKSAFHWFLLAALAFLLLEGVIFKTIQRSS